ncbi:SAP domain-containing protein [Wolbachia endosymbiont of Psylliodes chrysocephala]|uniref:SAP domain-containing protein n=1 Tax=Wolbachia endosymbiont of Psylliodes chrysocephala TaxID=2883236 RepID=UPI00209E2BAA|nr:SAP domain-containing protein [Wolbachia endosymbiont of Psylliodes chrysocephala]
MKITKTLNELKITEIKKLLTKRGLDKTGIKVTLIKRLQDAIISEGKDPETYCFELEENGDDEDMESKTKDTTTAKEEDPTAMTQDESQEKEGIKETGDLQARGDTTEMDLGNRQMLMILESIKFMREELKEESIKMREEQKEESIKMREELKEESIKIREEQKEESIKMREELKEESIKMREEQKEESKKMVEKLEEQKQYIIAVMVKKFEKQDKKIEDLNNNMKQELERQEDKMKDLQKNMQETVREITAVNIKRTVEIMERNGKKEMEDVKRSISKQIKEIECIKSDVKKEIYDVREETEREIKKSRVEIVEEIKRIKEQWRMTEGEGNMNIEELEEVHRRIRTIEEEVQRIRSQENDHMRGRSEEGRENEDRRNKKMREDMENIKEDLNRMRRQIGSGTTTIYNNCQGGTDESTRFDGNVKKIHPRVFLRILANKIRNMENFDDIRVAIRKDLTGQALLWYTSKEMNFKHFEDFESAFINMYWGEITQGEVRERLYFDCYDEKRGSSMYFYALMLYSQAQHLEPAIKEEEIVMFLSRHFKPQIAETIAVQNIKSFEQLGKYLMRIERNLISGRKKFSRNNLVTSNDQNNRNFDTNVNRNVNNRNYYRQNYPNQSNTNQNRNYNVGMGNYPNNNYNNNYNSNHNNNNNQQCFNQNNNNNGNQSNYNQNNNYNRRFIPNYNSNNVGNTRAYNTNRYQNNNTNNYNQNNNHYSNRSNENQTPQSIAQVNNNTNNYRRVNYNRRSNSCDRASFPSTQVTTQDMHNSEGLNVAHDANSPGSSINNAGTQNFH